MPRLNIQEEATIVRDKSTGKLVFSKNNTVVVI